MKRFFTFSPLERLVEGLHFFVYIKKSDFPRKFKTTQVVLVNLTGGSDAICSHGTNRCLEIIGNWERNRASCRESRHNTWLALKFAAFRPSLLPPSKPIRSFALLKRCISFSKPLTLRKEKAKKDKFETRPAENGVRGARSKYVGSTASRDS